MVWQILIMKQEREKEVGKEKVRKTGREGKSYRNPKSTLPYCLRDYDHYCIFYKKNNIFRSCVFKHQIRIHTD